jgi:hypothetical protein
MSRVKKGQLISDDQFMQHRLQLLEIMSKPGKIRKRAWLEKEHETVRKIKNENRIHKMKSKLHKAKKFTGKKGGKNNLKRRT